MRGVTKKIGGEKGRNHLRGVTKKVHTTQRGERGDIYFLEGLSEMRDG